jgi:hypothetical protein
MYLILKFFRPHKRGTFGIKNEEIYKLAYTIPVYFIFGFPLVSAVPIPIGSSIVVVVLPVFAADIPDLLSVCALLRQFYPPAIV